jgi:hypothetical protein
MKHQRSCSKCLLSFVMKASSRRDVFKKIELNSESICFDEFPERRFELAANLQIEKLPGDLKDAEYLFVAGFQFHEDFLLLQVKYDLLASGQDRAYSFRNARNRKDAAQRLQKFMDSEVSKEVSFEVTFHPRFAVLALNVHGFRHRSKTISVFSRLVKLRLRWMFLSK